MPLHTHLLSITKHTSVKVFCTRRIKGTLIFEQTCGDHNLNTLPYPRSLVAVFHIYLLHFNMAPSDSLAGLSTAKQTRKKKVRPLSCSLAVGKIADFLQMLNKAKKSTSLLDLPGEIRNRIYRNLLVTPYVAARVPNPEYLASRAESEPINHPSEPLSRAVGTLRCKNIWKAECDFGMAILRVNRQIHQEAFTIFRDENRWIVLESNKPGFGRALRKNGFNVVYCGDVGQIETPILLTIAVLFPTLDTGTIDTCILSPIDIDQLPRALWTAVGMEGIILRLCLSPGLSEKPDIEDVLVQPFTLVRGIRAADVIGSPKFADSLPEVVRNPYENSAHVLGEMTQFITVVQSEKEQGLWLSAAETCEMTITFLADCYKVYGSDFIESNVQVFSQIRLVTVKFAMDLSELRSSMRQYETGLKYAKYALRIALPPTPLYRLHLLRGQAYTGMKQHTKAMRDLLTAQEYNPGDPVVLSALSTLKKSLDPEPAKAMNKFKKLHAAVEKYKVGEQQRLSGGKIIFKDMGDGSPIIVEDHRGAMPVEVGRIDATGGGNSTPIAEVIAALQSANIS